MKKFQIYLEEEELDYIVEHVLERQLHRLEKGDSLVYSFDPEEEKKAVKKAIKAYKFVLSEFRP